MLVATWYRAGIILWLQCTGNPLVLLLGGSGIHSENWAALAWSWHGWCNTLISCWYGWRGFSSIIALSLVDHRYILLLMTINMASKESVDQLTDMILVWSVEIYGVPTFFILVRIDRSSDLIACTACDVLAVDREGSVAEHWHDTALADRWRFTAFQPSLVFTQKIHQKDTHLSGIKQKDPIWVMQIPVSLVRCWLDNDCVSRERRENLMSFSEEGTDKALVRKTLERLLIPYW